MIVTIDGPVASGKSTIARTLARRLNYFYLYSGILFRALAYILVNHFGYSKEKLADPHEHDVYEVLKPERFVYEYDDQFRPHVFYDGVDITPYLKDRFIDEIVTVLAGNRNIRLLLRELQHQLGDNGSDLVAEGRDMGTVVFPQADLKLYLTASLDVRAERWRMQQEQYGAEYGHDEATAIIDERDCRDCERSVSPLCVPEGSVIIDSSTLAIEETLEQVLARVREALAKK